MTRLALLAGSASQALGTAIATRLEVTPIQRIIARFPDSELHIELQDSIRGADLFLVQSTAPPADEHLVELLLLADAARRAGAERVTAVMPYFGYARQDRRASGREPVGARVMADALGSAGRVDRIVALDLHSTALEGVFGVPLEHLSAAALLTEALRPYVTTSSIVVAPDLGAVHVAERYAQRLGLPVAIVHKTRISGEDVEVRTLTGDVTGRRPIIVDDMISTGGTIAAAVRALRGAGALNETVVAATHGLFVGQAATLLGQLSLHALLVSDSIAGGDLPGLAVRRLGVAGLLADAIGRLHRGDSLGDLIAHR
jgi:ribose-phosphate pyrophosphokinase